MRRRRGVIRRAIPAASRAISFLSWQKRYGRKDRWDEIALSRRKGILILRTIHRKRVPQGTPFGRAAEFLQSKILLRQIFVPAKSKSLCPESTRRLSCFSRFCSAVSIACRKETRQAKKPKVRVYLKTPNAPGQWVFSRCTAPFFLEIRQYSCEKMSCSTQKFLAAGHIGSWKNTP